MTKKILFFSLIVVFLLPLIQKEINLLEEGELNGHFDLIKAPQLNSENWFSQNFQDSVEEFTAQEIGFKNALVRFYNQRLFSCYGIVNTQEVTVGKNNVLFDDRHIKTFIGEDYIGKKAITEKVKNIKQAADSLKKNNKELLIVLAPNKARYFEKSIPNSYQKIDTTNYEIFIQQLEQQQINYLDFNKWFIANKHKHEVNLIPKYGIHWGDYAASLVMDSVVTFCNSRYNYQLPHFDVVSQTITNTPSDLDYDLGKSLNLITKVKDEQYIYPKLKLKQGQKQSLLGVGDSYLKVFYDNHMLDSVFDIQGFWYYNRDVLNESRKKSDDDLKAYLPNSDIVIIMLTEWNMYRLGFGIIEEINSYYTGKKIESTAVRQYMDKIRADKKWMEDIKKQALERSISVDSMLVRNARYMIKKKSEQLN